MFSRLKTAHGNALLVFGEVYLNAEQLNLTLVFLTEAGKALQQVTSRGYDNYIQLLPFKNKPGKTFTLQIKFGDATIAEDIYLELSQRLQLQYLVTTHLKDIEELIIIPHLYLHQIPFTALPIANQTVNISGSSVFSMLNQHLKCQLI